MPDPSPRRTIHYAADGTEVEIVRPVDDESGLPKQVCRCKPVGPDRDQFDVQIDHSEELRRYWKAWRPSIFMPHWASRLTLEVTEVRVQRLQEVSHDEALLEGIHEATPGNFPLRAQRMSLALHAFAEWDGMHGKKPGCSWADSPWAWAISFRLLEPVGSGGGAVPR